jgi:hypothetical protein
MEDSEAKKEPEIKDERPAARPSMPFKPPLTQSEFYHAAVAKRKEARLEKNKRESLQLKEFMKVKGKILLVAFAIALVAGIVWLSNADSGPNFLENIVAWGTVAFVILAFIGIIIVMS